MLLLFLVDLNKLILGFMYTSKGQEEPTKKTILKMVEGFALLDIEACFDSLVIRIIPVILGQFHMKVK